MAPVYILALLAFVACALTYPKVMAGIVALCLLHILLRRV